PRPHPTDLAKSFEKLALDPARKADRPRSHSPLHRIAVEVLDRVEADFRADLILQMSAIEFGDQYFVFKCPDGQRERFPCDGQRLTCNFRDHVRLITPRSGRRKASPSDKL